MKTETFIYDNDDDDCVINYARHEYILFYKN